MGQPLVQGAIFRASQGADLVLEELSVYSDPEPCSSLRDRGQARFEAIGEGSHLSLKGLARVFASNNGFCDLHGTGISAVDGGTVTLGQLTTIPSGQIYFSTTGEGSSIRLEIFELYQDPPAIFESLSFYVGDGTQIALPNLRALIGGFIFLAGNGTFETPSLVNIDGTSFDISDGATYTLPSTIPIYRGPSALALPYLRAKGAGSKLDLSGLQTLRGSTGVFTTVSIEAVDGGVVDITGLTRLDQSGSVTLTAKGRGSTINAEGISTIVSEEFKPVSIKVERDASIRLNNLKVIRDAMIDFSGGNLELPSLTDINGSSIAVRNGAEWKLPRGDNRLSRYNDPFRRNVSGNWRWQYNRFVFPSVLLWKHDQLDALHDFACGGGWPGQSTVP